MGRLSLAVLGMLLLVNPVWAQRVDDPNALTQAQQDTTGQTAPRTSLPSREAWQPEQRVIDVQVTAAQQSDYARDLIRKEGGSDVPILLPYSMSKDEATAQAYKMRMRVQRDDYTVVLRKPDMDIVIIGTSNYFPGRREVRAQRQGDYMQPYERFTDGEGGALSFGRFGADYLVEFYCLPDENRKGQACIDEAGARAFVQQMLSGE